MKKTSTNHQQAVSTRQFIYGLILAIFIAISPYLFYTYRIPPEGAQEWESIFGTIHASEFYDVSAFLHALFTKISLLFFSSLGFLYIKYFWKWTLLIPVTMYLYQLQSVINTSISVFDVYSFEKSLIITIPILSILIFSAIKINKKKDPMHLVEMLDRIDHVVDQEKTKTSHD